jgi:hypothetical protein
MQLRKTLKALKEKILNSDETFMAYISDKRVKKTLDQDDVLLINDLVRLDISHDSELYFLLHGYGGNSNSALQIAKILHRYYASRTFIVPYFATSALGMLSLSGDKIFVDEYSYFSSLDPQIILNGLTGSEGVYVTSIRDIEKTFDFFYDYAKMTTNEDRQLIASRLFNAVHPTVFGKAYRSKDDMLSTIQKSLSLSCHYTQEKIETLAHSLVFTEFSHENALFFEDMQALGVSENHLETGVDNLYYELISDCQEIFQSAYGAESIISAIFIFNNEIYGYTYIGNSDRGRYGSWEEIQP